MQILADDVWSQKRLEKGEGTRPETQQPRWGSKIGEVVG
jgi:hypothetical protein